MKVFLQLFFEFFKISLFVIGGGYAIIAAAEAVFTKKKWIKDGELLDHLSIFQMIPGLIATHTAVYVGRKLKGSLGAVVAVFAVALPSVIIFTFVSLGYDSLPLDHPRLVSAFTGLRSALTGIIAATIIRGWMRNLPDFFAYSILLAALIALFYGIPVPYVLLGAIIIGILRGVCPRKDNGVCPPKTFSCASWPALLLFLKYGALCFGGGFVLVPMYIEDFVGPAARFLQVPPEEFADLMALTQMTPGPIGVNGATYFGFRLAGIPGAVLASAALLLPGSILAYLAFASLERFKTNRIVKGLLAGVRPASLALMLVALVAFMKISIFEHGNFNTIALIIGIISILMTLTKKLNVVLLVLISALTASALKADEISVARFPDADTVLVKDINKVTYKTDATYEESSESWTKILTEKGRREESILKLRYSKRYGWAKIEYVGAIDENGVEREIDISATTNESTDNSSMASNIYDPLDRRIVCSIPGLRVGETLHIKTRRAETSARCEGVWSDISIMEWSCPILDSTVEITAPFDMPIRQRAIRHPLGNVTESVVTNGTESIVYTFHTLNSPQAFPEEDMPRLSHEVQHLRVSTASTWEELSRWYWNLCLPHISRTTEDMTNKVAEITKNLSTDNERMRAIFKFVSQEIRYMGLTMEDTSPGYAPHDIDITFNNRYGVCRDKAGLLTALLRIGGFNAYPVLINVGDKLDPVVPQPHFNHAIVAVVGPAGEIELMDPTNENAKDLLPAYESDKSFIVCCPEGDVLRTTPSPSAEHNSLRVATTGRLDSNGTLFLENTLDFSGINDTSYRSSLVKMTIADRRKFFERVIKAVAPGAELVSCSVEPQDMRDTDKPIRVILSSRIPEAIIQGETCGELAVPFISRTVGVANFLFDGNATLEKRRFNLLLNTTASTTETIDIDLGDAVGPVKILPSDLSLTGDYAFTRTFAVENGHLRAMRRAAVDTITISPEAYPALRESLKIIEAAERRRPVFSRDKLANADVHWLVNATEADIHGPHAWTTTNRIAKQLLTYKGKKSSAELKFAFNPAVEDLKLVSATVTNPDGSRSSVSDKEMNMMDCNWAASAARYPASKLLVVNLPSVEIGSVIEYTLVRSVTNAPSAFYGSYYFDSVEPLDRRFVRVNDTIRDVTPRRLANEQGQPYASLWRDRLTISSNNFTSVAAEYRAAEENLSRSEELGETAESLIADIPEEATAIQRIAVIRNWMAKHIRIAGPSLWELPFALQLTDPSVILKERYATRLDYVRTMAALINKAGYDADVVFAANDADDPEELRADVLYTHPNVQVFANPLCRVVTREGGFLGFGATKKTYYIGLENEYSPIGVSPFARATFLDLSNGELGKIEIDPFFVDSIESYTAIDVRENGAVDMFVGNKLYGTSVGPFRKKFSEILPEDRSRLHQALLGEIAQGASATSDLSVDLAGYPAAQSFTCFVPDYAMLGPDTITIQLEPLLSSIPTFTGTSRETPFAVPETDTQKETVIVNFPKGYVEIEHLPTEFAFTDPRDATKLWLTSKNHVEVKDDTLTVTIHRTIYPRPYSYFAADFIELIRDRNRIASSRANRTIVVRKAAHAN